MISSNESTYKTLLSNACALLSSLIEVDSRALQRQHSEADDFFSYANSEQTKVKAITSFLLLLNYAPEGEPFDVQYNASHAGRPYSGPLG
jgi:hypothetical protein